MILPAPERDRSPSDYTGAVDTWHGKRASLYESHFREQLADNDCGAFLVWGDPSLYDSTLRIMRQAVMPAPQDGCTCTHLSSASTSRFAHTCPDTAYLGQSKLRLLRLGVVVVLTSVLCGACCPALRQLHRACFARACPRRRVGEYECVFLKTNADERCTRAHKHSLRITVRCVAEPSNLKR